ncbi:MAG: TetR/AcrR family transcriptional repressor of nem operon [Crocinitomicaceae bacterium]|jgi:TetR/AcrR family transcriptional repressor of nem operon
MARKKNYIEGEVIEKAMQLFWSNGYENTSMQMLEDKMGINKFSIYSSFGSKHGLFLESLKAYKERTKGIFEDFKNATNGVEDIKKFFYDSVDICNRKGNQKGCLVTTTYLDFFEKEDELINHQMTEFMNNLKDLFIEKLKMNSIKNEETVLREANFLLLAKNGLASASRVNDEKEISDYIEMTFKNISPF